MSGQTPQTLTSLLAKHLTRPVSPGLYGRASDHILDWLGCAIAGRTEPAGQILMDRYPTGAGARAFRLGGLGNILEMDDVDKRGRLHPGPVIVPATLACARDLGANGAAVFDAVIRGYEATIRLGRAAGDTHYAFWHSTGSCGAIGAAAAAASVMLLDDQTTAHALALAVSQTAGFWQTRHEPSSMGKQLHTAHASRAGLEAAELARAGFKGPLTILEGSQGFFAATCGSARAPDVLVDYGRDWLISEVSFKPWPACRHAHAAIDAALEFRQRGGSLDMQPIVIETYRDALVFCDKPDPKTVIEAKFSIQHAVAVTLLRGEPSLDDFSMQAIENEQVKAVRARIQVKEAEPYASAYPARFGARLISNSFNIDKPDALGDPENPVGHAQLEGKAWSLMRTGGLSAGKAVDLINACKTCDQEFFRLLDEALP
jgi:2-methylcitrate dehydratase PrpD